MKKAIITLVCAFFALNASAGVFNFGFSVGYSNSVRDIFTTDYYGISKPNHFFNMDCTIWHIYIGGGLSYKNTGYNVYGYNEQMYSELLKIGIVINMCGSSEQYDWNLCPFFGVTDWGIKDSSGNSIGARTQYGVREHKPLFGIRNELKLTDYIALEFHISNIETGFGIGYSIGFDDSFLFW